MRKTYNLTAIELKQFQGLRRIWPPSPGPAMEFWAKVAVARNLDPKSVISEGATFTALPEGHGMPWCYPMPLKCSKKAVYHD
jgi:hypothetical protein